MNIRLRKTTGYLLSALTCALYSQVEATPSFHCITGDSGEWLCSSPNNTPLTKTGAVADKKTSRDVSTANNIGDTTRQAIEIETAASLNAQPSHKKILQSLIETEPEINPVSKIAIHCSIKEASTNTSAPFPNRKNQITTIDADEMEIHERNLFHYSGNVVMSHADQLLKADNATYNQKSAVFEAEGNVLYSETGMEITGERIRFDSDSDSGVIHNANYKIDRSHASGEAERAEKAGSYLNRYTNASYSTCDPDNRSWEMRAEEIEMDDLDGWGSAKNAVVRFKGVPILYSPNHTFPTDERRKSGFLFPSWGYTNKGGADLSAPYYWNIAPNRDAILTPRAITKRGAHLSGDFRYLNPNNSGEMSASLLPDDDVRGNNRYQLKIAHTGSYQESLDQPLRYEINYASLSDTDYLTDFGNNLGLASTNTLEQTAKVSYNATRWNLSALLSDHYNVDKNLATADEPYRKLPQIDAQWSSQKGDNQLNYEIEGQFAHFDHPDPSKLSAERYWTKPAIDYNYTFLNESAFIKPALSVSYGRYELEDGSSSNMTVPHYTLETGLFFERDGDNYTGLLGNDYLQTLEPKLKFSYIPDGKSSGQNFDSPITVGNTTLDLSEFYGKDSAPYTKQITWSVDSDYILNSDNKTMVATSLEQTRDFKNTRTRDWSNLVANISTDFGSHHTRLEMDWDPYDNWNDTLRADYQFDNLQQQVFNLGYIYERDTKKQLDLSAAWKLNPQWSLVGRYNHELLSSNSHRLENLLGLKYDTCCWAIRFMRRNYFTGAGSSVNQYDTTWLVALELKGLGNIGKSEPLDTLLTDSIRGYRSEP